MSVDKLGLCQICNVKLVSNLNNVYLHILETICKIAGNVGCQVMKN